MADKLYPPTLAGTIPPFIKGTSKLEVPFTMNRLVSINQVNGMWLRIRDANTDIDFGTIFTPKDYIVYNQEQGYYIATFILENTIDIKFIKGNYYKIQIAYIDSNNNNKIGYYSTVAITKCTAMPTVLIQNLNDNQSNNNQEYYIGVYNNLSDPSEKDYQYMFELSLEDETIIDNTGWCYHNSNNDTLSYEAKDTYNLLHDLNNYNKVYIQYKVKTNNGLICESSKYWIIGVNGIAPTIQTNLKAELDYNNGCVNLFLKPNNVTVNISNVNNSTYFGKFVLSRATEKNNYQIWIPIYRFELTGKLPEKLFTDFTCVHGESYKYCIQQYNDNNIYSSKILSNNILVEFEHIFLYDGEKQLKINFNPKISSFKTVFSESKKTTLGAQYPYFFRNGNIEYKEFPISGLISYIMDENQYFLSKTNDLEMPDDWIDTYDIIDKNITYERKFREAVLNWLNNGQLKLFRSSTEGNYIVRLMNTSLVADEKISRMIATFTTTATEAIEYNENNLLEYKFFDNSLHTIDSGLFYYNIDLNQLTEKNSLNLIKNTDFLFGYKCVYFKIENLRVSTPLNLTIGGKTYIMANNYDHEIYFTEPQSNLYFINLSQSTNGTIIIGIKYNDNNLQNAIINSNIKSRSVNNITNQLRYNSIISLNYYKQIDYLNYIGSNWISRYQGIIEEDFQYLKGTAYSLDELYKIPLSKLQIGDIYQINNDYYQYVTNNSYNGPSSWDRYKKVNIKTEISRIYSIKFTLNNQVYKFNTLNDLEIQYNCNLSKSDNKYLILFNGKNNYTDVFVSGALFIIKKYYENNQYKGEMILLYDDNHLIIMPQYKFYDEDYGLASLLENQIYIDGKVYKLSNTESLVINDLNNVPKIIQWGYSIKAIINYEIVQKIYSIDNNIQNIYDLYNYSKCCCAAQILKLKHYTKKPSFKNIIFSEFDAEIPTNILYHWNGINFEVTNDDNLSEYWGSVSNDEFDLKETIDINGISYTYDTLINDYVNNRNNYFIQLNNNATVAIENKIFEGNDYGISIV